MVVCNILTASEFGCGVHFTLICSSFGVGFHVACAVRVQHTYNDMLCDSSVHFWPDDDCLARLRIHAVVPDQSAYCVWSLFTSRHSTDTMIISIGIPSVRVTKRSQGLPPAY
jgi:hypothetical protein